MDRFHPVPCLVACLTRAANPVLSLLGFLPISIHLRPASLSLRRFTRFLQKCLGYRLQMEPGDHVARFQVVASRSIALPESAKFLLVLPTQCLPKSVLSIPTPTKEPIPPRMGSILL